ASGQLGGAIARQLIADLGSDPVVALARTPDKAASLGIETRPGDYGDRATLEASLVGVDVVVLISGNGNPEERIPLHRNVLAAAKAAGVRKLVYTSVLGAEEGSAFAPIVKSNRQTEADVRDCGMQWSIGRNGLYIEPDLAYATIYAEQGTITNSAGDGRCAYTTRAELAVAYSALVREERHHGQTYTLTGEPITQEQLAGLFREHFGMDVRYVAQSVEAYRKERTASLGPFMGTVVSGIYAGIRSGAFDTPSQFEAAAGRPHASWDEVFATAARDHRAAR
ncbi:MAG: NAD(P)H-binding protein, partial [Myxococcota bacterium]